MVATPSVQAQSQQQSIPAHLVVDFEVDGLLRLDADDELVGGGVQVGPLLAAVQVAGDVPGGGFEGGAFIEDQEVRFGEVSTLPGTCLWGVVPLLSSPSLLPRFAPPVLPSHPPLASLGAAWAAVLDDATENRSKAALSPELHPDLGVAAVKGLPRLE